MTTNKEKVLAWAEREGVRSARALTHARDGVHVGGLLFEAGRLDRAAASLRLGKPGWGERVSTAKEVTRYARSCAATRIEVEGA